MKRLVSTLSIALLAALCLPLVAHAQYGINHFDVTYTNEDGSPDTQAGSHPFAQTTSIEVSSELVEFPFWKLSGAAKDLFIEQITGFTGNSTAVPRCPDIDFATIETTYGGENNSTACPDSTVVGINGVSVLAPIAWFTVPLYNLTPPPGVPARFGFVVEGVPVTVDVTVKSGGEYNLIASSRNIPQTVKFFGTIFQLWGDPSDPAHDSVRGECGINLILPYTIDEVPFENGPGVPESCPVERLSKAFLTLPRACNGPLPTNYETDSWNEPGDFVSGSALTHDGAEPPEPQGLTGCGRLGFDPSIAAEPSTKAAQSPTGLDFSLNMQNEGLANVAGISESDIRKAEVTLPEGMTANPSLAEGLGVCTEANLQRETLDAEPGAGCPNASKIGTVEVESQLVEEKINGSLFIAKPYENPFHSILAMYIVIKSPKLGIIVKQPLRVDRDPQTGQLTTVAEDMPQLPFSHFKLHFRSGARAPLSSPPACGTYEAKATLYPWSGGEPVTTNGAFEIISGADNGPCPSGGLPAFHPHLEAGAINNAAGRFSPFYVRLSREDGEQEITHFSIKLPPGVTGKLAGIPFCPESAIAAAKAREGQPHGGTEESEHPSCPAASEVGHTLVGAGVGPALTYAPGKIYLAGPYHGAPISFVAITSGIVGPFDIGTVVVRFALRVNPETGEVFIDATGSDPIPHIVEGFPVDLRDIRAYNDRPSFVLNPTNCTPTSTASTVLGSGLDFASEADDNPLTVTSPFQAADCAQLPFEPKLTLRLVGPTNRGAHPALHAHLAMHGIGEAGVAKAQVTLPHSEFIENAHFKTICTRVQFNSGAGNGVGCPAGSIYGHASASTPLLAEPVQGNIYLRSNPERELPDVVAALHGSEINADLVGHVDSVKGGGIRTTFEDVPDVPVTSADFAFAGKSKGLFVNSTNLCAKKHRAIVHFDGQNGKRHYYNPVLRVGCGGSRKKHHRSR